MIYFFAAIINLGSFFIGYHLVVYTLSWEKAQMVYGITDNIPIYKGVITSALPLGAIFGCLSGNFLL